MLKDQFSLLSEGFISAPPPPLGRARSNEAAPLRDSGKLYITLNDA